MVIVIKHRRTPEAIFWNRAGTCSSSNGSLPQSMTYRITPAVKRRIVSASVLLAYLIHYEGEGGRGRERRERPEA